MLGIIETIGLIIVKKTVVMMLLIWLKRIGVDVVHLILKPPMAFILILLILSLISLAVSGWAFRRGSKKERKSEAYSCGENFNEHLIQPDYSQFFPFAFFFTILHVVALVVATVPTGNLKVFTIAFIYLAVAVLGMSALLRRDV